MIKVEKKKVDFSNMDNRALKSFIDEKKSKVEEYRSLIERATNKEEVALAGAKGEFEADQLEQARAEQDKRANEVLEENASGFNPNATFRSASFSMNGGKTNDVVPADIDKLALRSNEKIAERLGLKNSDNLDLGKYIRGMVTGNWENAEAERRSYTTSATGVLIPSVLSAEIIDAARNVSLFTSAGVPLVPMTTNNLTIARVKKDPTFNFKAEGQAVVGNTEMELDSVELKAKTIFGQAKISLEAIHSSQNLTDIIYQSFSGAMANGIDNGILYGQYNSQSKPETFAPAGIMNDADINTITATNDAYNDFIKAIGAVRRANGNPTAMGINAETDELLNLLKDNNGNYLEVPKVVADLQKIVSNQLKSDETAGNDALVFDPKAMVIGVQNDIRLQMSNEVDENGMITFTIYSMVDGTATRPTHITKITGIKEKTTVTA